MIREIRTFICLINLKLEKHESFKINRMDIGNNSCNYYDTRCN